MSTGNLHAPTVPSGPTTAPVANGNATHLTITELHRKKDMVEGELKALGGVLDSVRCSTGLSARSDLLTRGSTAST
jgi:26S proteasome non-ATPase regulatory subunit 9